MITRRLSGPLSRGLSDALTLSKGGGYQAAISALRSTLTTAGIWAKGEELYIFAADNETQALTNLLTGAIDCTKVGSPDFRARQGFAGDGSSTRLQSRAFSAMTKLAQNSASYFVYTTSPGASGNFDMGSSGAGEKVAIAAVNTTTTCVMRQNTSTSDSVAIVREWGFRGSFRTVSGSYLAQMDDVQSTVTQASVGVPGGNLIIGGASTAFSRHRIAAAGIFSGLSGSEATILRTAVETCLASIGTFSNQIWGEGDSYMAGVSGSVPLCGEISVDAGRPLNNTGAGGSTMSAAATRAATKSAYFGQTLVFWDGSPDGFVSLSASMANYATIVGLLTHSRYIIVPPVRRAAMSAQTLSDTLSIQTALAAAYPGHIWDAQAYLATLGNPVSDATDIANNVVPSSLLIGDAIHLNAATVAACGAQIAALLASNGW